MEHVAEAPTPERVQALNVPVLFVASVIVPVGVSAGAGEVSETVTVQATAILSTVVVGQLIPIALALRVEVIAPLVPLLVECTLSP